MIFTPFIAPTPNCGHGGTTFTWFRLPKLWLCVKCALSIGPLYARCAACGNYAPDGTQLISVYRAGRLCIHCRPRVLETRRLHQRNEQ